MQIDIKAEFSIQVAKETRLSGETKIRVPFSDAVHAEVDLDLTNRRCILQLAGLSVEPEVVCTLVETQALVNRGDYPAVLSGLEEKINSTADIALHAWKYLLARDERIPHGALAGLSRQWKESSSNEWRKFPSWIAGSVSVAQIPVLVGSNAQRLQQIVADGVTPLVGMRYLHRAKAEGDPRYRWVDATIAAELAIKEILQMARPETTVLFDNLPSPPLSKLYGEVLEAYLGERSPHLKAIVKGVEKRNALVHRTLGVDIDVTEAEKYVGTIEEAIFHALNLYYKNKGYFEFP